jgi:two-component system, sensor histidine kinase RpfC
MELLRNLSARLHARTDSEHEQAALRILIVGMLLAYMALFHKSGTSSDDAGVVWVIAGIFVVTLGIFAAICCWPQANVPRRLLGMLADNASATWYMSIAGEYGFSMIGVYLFVTFGNGFRYGRRYLFASQLLCLAGFLYVLQWAPYWRIHRSAGVGLLLALIVLPLYIATLLERIQDALARAEEANLAKTSFLANMSHEMRTPLNGIVGVVDLLKTTALTVQQSELVALMRHSTSVLRSLVDDVLDISKIEAGRLTIEVTPFDLHASINGLVQLLRPHAQSKGLLLRAVIDPSLEYRLKGDSHHLRQILLNLLGNAIKFTERGEVTLAVGLKQETAQAVTARFEVKDTGIGIAAEALPRIFERFVQADESTTRKFGGTGLGTTIAKQLAELMGGNIGVESTLGQGSTFWVELPLLKETASVATEPTVPETEPAQRSSDGVTLVLASAGIAHITAALSSIGERYEIVGPVTPLDNRIGLLLDSGVPIRMIVAACNVDQACSAFALAAQRLGEQPVALVYVANAELPILDKVRVNSIKGAFALEYATPKLLSNAIHAVSAGVERSVDAAVDLGMLLKHERTRLTVLVAEDNATNQKIISQLLENAGHRVILASDGEEALDLYEAERPDVAILDFNMPHRTGVEVIQAVRMMEPSGARMPCLILSASVTPEAKNRAKQAGADEFMGKPFDAATLVQLIDRLGKRTERATLRTSSDASFPKTESEQVSSADRKRVHRPFKRDVRTAGQALGQTEARNALVDMARLAQLEDIARTSSFLGELIGGFATDVQSILQKAQRCMTASETDDLPDLMHALKGAAVGVGANQLATLAAELESCADTLSTRELEPKLNAIQACFSATSSYLDNYVRTNHDAPL